MDYFTPLPKYFSTGRGFFTSLFVLKVWSWGLYLYQNKWEEIGQQLPIIYELTGLPTKRHGSGGAFQRRRCGGFMNSTSHPDVFSKQGIGA